MNELFHPSGVNAVVINLVSRFVHTGGLLVVGCSVLASAVEAGCYCGRGGSASSGVYGPVVGPSYAGGDSYSLGGMDDGGYVDASGFGGSPVYGLPLTPEVAPPPGTLGQTYQRPMRPIPVDKHPRVSIVDVRAPGATSVKVYGTNEYRTKDGFTGFQDRKDPSVWRLESEPLVPGVPHIYRVVAKYGDTMQEKYIRLVPGRIVTLEF